VEPWTEKVHQKAFHYNDKQSDNNRSHHEDPEGVEVRKDLMTAARRSRSPQKDPESIDQHDKNQRCHKQPDEVSRPDIQDKYQGHQGEKEEEHLWQTDEGWQQSVD